MNQNTTLPATSAPLGKWVAEQRAKNPQLQDTDPEQAAEFEKKLTELKGFKDIPDGGPTPA